MGWIKDRVDALLDARLGPAFAATTRALVVRTNEFGFDPFGFHKDSLRYAAIVARFFYRDYFRCQVTGIDNVPPGRVLLVANHSGQLPFDGMCIGAAMFLDAKPPRIVRSMVEKFVPSLPFVSYLFPRWGQITGTPENCHRLLEAEEAILVFPEGARGIAKPFSRRYQLEEFGLGFMRIALAAKTPIVPVAVIGAEEQVPAVNVRPLARLFKLPSFPVMPFPPFVPVPLPVKYRIAFGEPLRFEGDPDDDDDVIEDKVRVVKSTIQSMLRLGLGERENVFW